MPNITISESDKSQIDNIFINSSYSGKMLISETPGPTPSAYIINEDLTFEPDESIQMAFISHALSGLSQDGMWCDIKIGDNDIVTFNVQYANMGGDYIYYGTYENSLVGKFIQFSYVDEEPTEGDIRGAIMCMGFDGFSSEEPTTIRVTMRETAQALKTLTLMNGDEIYYTTSAPAGTIISGDEIEAPEPEENYAFVGWYNSDETTEYTFPYTLNDNITMYATFGYDYTASLYSFYNVDRELYPYVIIWMTNINGFYKWCKPYIYFIKYKPSMSENGSINASIAPDNCYSGTISTNQITYTTTLSNVSDIIQLVKDNISNVTLQSFSPLIPGSSEAIVYTNFDLEHKYGLSRFNLVEHPETPIRPIIDNVIFNSSLYLGKSSSSGFTDNYCTAYWDKFNVSDVIFNKRIKLTIGDDEYLLDSAAMKESDIPEYAGDTNIVKCAVTDEVWDEDSLVIMPDRIDFADFDAPDSTINAKVEILSDIPYYLICVVRPDNNFSMAILSSSVSQQKISEGVANIIINVDGSQIYSSAIEFGTHPITGVIIATIEDDVLSQIYTGTSTVIDIIDANSQSHHIVPQFVNHSDSLLYGNIGFISEL